MSKLKKYRVANLKGFLALPFKPGFYSNTSSYNNTFMKTVMFPIKDNSVMDVYRSEEYLMRGVTITCWFLYNHELRSTFLSNKPPDKIDWLIPFVENYNLLWSNLNV